MYTYLLNMFIYLYQIFTLNVSFHSILIPRHLAVLIYIYYILYICIYYISISISISICLSIYLSIHLYICPLKTRKTRNIAVLRKRLVEFVEF